MAALLLFVVAAVAAPGPPESLAPGQRQIWRPAPDAIADLHDCTAPRPECVRKVMERHGASAEAVEFYRRTGWFLSGLKETGGAVMLATVLDPWRANENDQPALVGGVPEVVYPEEVTVPVEKDAGFRALKKRFPRLMFWKPGPALESSAVTAAGQRFLFRYRLLDGCHACAIRGWARIEFDFAPDGTYRGARLRNIVRGKA